MVSFVRPVSNVAYIQPSPPRSFGCQIWWSLTQELYDVKHLWNMSWWTASW